MFPLFSNGLQKRANRDLETTSEARLGIPFARLCAIRWETAGTINLANLPLVIDLRREFQRPVPIRAQKWTFPHPTEHFSHSTDKLASHADIGAFTSPPKQAESVNDPGNNRAGWDDKLLARIHRLFSGSHLGIAREKDAQQRTRRPCGVQMRRAFIIAIGCLNAARR